MVLIYLLLGYLPIDHVQDAGDEDVSMCGGRNSSLCGAGEVACADLASCLRVERWCDGHLDCGDRCLCFILLILNDITIPQV